MNKYDPREKVPTAPNIVESFTYPVQDLNLPTQFWAVQKAIQEGVPVARINSLQVEKDEIIEPVVDESDCVLVSKLTEAFYGDLGALSEPADEGLEQLHFNSVGIVAPFEYAIIPKTCTHRPDTSEEGIVRKFFGFS